jgi:1-acyl-sn-glycerol-3-phosphate acyltransferase
MTVDINDVDVTEQIRKPEVTTNVHYIASAGKLREELVQMQRDFAARQSRIVTEGRDQGTVAFSDADVKFFLTATSAERVRRRFAELQAKGEKIGFEQVKKDIEKRDKSDYSRTVGPLKPADDAIVVDTTDLTIEQVVEKLLGYVKMPAKRPKMMWFRFARFLCKIFCRLFFRMHFYGLENIPQDGALVLISNHQSFLDPLFCGINTGRPLFFLARDTLFKNWFFGPLLVSVNAIPVRRGEADLGAIKKVIAKLKEGHGVCLFPEGTRTSDGRIAVFKSGLGLLCRRGNAAMVPVVIDGAFECWPRHKKIFPPGAEIVVIYGKPITADEISNISDEQLAENLTKTMRCMQGDCRVRHNKKPYDY